MKTIAAIAPDIIVVAGFDHDTVQDGLAAFKKSHPDIMDRYLFVVATDVDRILALPEIPQDVREAAEILGRWLDPGDE